MEKIEDDGFPSSDFLGPVDHFQGFFCFVCQG